MARTEAKQWMLRVDEKQTLEQTVERISSFYVWLKTDGFVVREEADAEASNPHYHFYIEGVSKESTLRAKVKFLFGVGGNQEYSVKEMTDPPRYLRYLCKGPGSKSQPDTRKPPVVVYRRGERYTDEFIRAEYEAFWSENAATAAKQSAKQTRHVSKESKTQRMVKEALEHFANRVDVHGRFVDPDDGQWSLTRDVLDWIVTKLGGNMEAISDHWVMGVANCVVCRLSQEGKDAYVSHLMKRMRGL